MNSFNGIRLGETKIHIGKMLIPWKEMGILTCINNSLDLDQILNLEQLIELYTYVAVYNYSRGDEKILTRVWQSIDSARTTSEYDRETIGIKKDYSGMGIKKVVQLLLDGKEVFGFVDANNKVSFYKQSQFLLALVSNPRKFLGIHGIWINLSAILFEFANIRFHKKKHDDVILQGFKRIYKRLVKGIKWTRKTKNPSQDKVFELIKIPNSEITVHTNNTGRITSIEHAQKKSKSG